MDAGDVVFGVGQQAGEFHRHALALGVAVVEKKIPEDRGEGTAGIHRLIVKNRARATVTGVQHGVREDRDGGAGLRARNGSQIVRVHPDDHWLPARCNGTGGRAEVKPGDDIGVRRQGAGTQGKEEI